MISPELQQALQSYFPGAPWDRMDLTVRSLRGFALAPTPMALAPRALLAVTMKGCARALQTAGMTIGRHIFIDPSFNQPQTAAGIALVAHEIVHVQQGEQDPGFESKYDLAAQDTDPNRPWENPYEYEAYLKECQVYWDKVREGWPPGGWQPLGVQLNLCG
jgi:hypothetical protein